MSSDFQLREVYNATTVEQISSLIKKNYPEFDSQMFSNKILTSLEKLNFGDRGSLITDALYDSLPQDFIKAADILLHSLGPELETDDLTGYDGFYILPMTSYVSRYGVEYFDLSMKLLYEMTKRFTSEGAVRIFIEKYPTKSLKLMELWTKDPNTHVRRLVSEGSRPRLPLASPLRAFVKNPAPVILLLDKLKDSPERLVQRSIANNLNDISKDNPQAVTDTLERWNSEKVRDIDWITSHALRTILKRGNRAALELLGYKQNHRIDVSKVEVKTLQLQIGSNLVFAFSITSEIMDPQNLMIDFIIHFMKSSGKTRSKVFKLSKRAIKNREKIEFTKKFEFKQRSTRKLYPGVHEIQIQINGKQYEKVSFAVSI